MLGKLIGAVASAPIRVVSVPVKAAQKATQAADEFMFGNSKYNYRAPRRNVLDKVADAVDDSCREAFNDD